MTIKPIALAAAILAALTISFLTEAKSDTLSSAEEAVEEGKISDKDLDVFFDRLKDAYKKGGKDSSFDWKGMSGVILGEILKSDNVQKNKKLKDILDILTGGDTLLILKEKDEEWEKDQSISIVHAPILVAAPRELNLPSDRKILIFKRSGGGAKEDYVALTSHDGKYITVGEAEEIKDQEIHGTLLLVQKEKAPTLEEKEKK